MLVTAASAPTPVMLPRVQTNRKNWWIAKVERCQPNFFSAWLETGLSLALRSPLKMQVGWYRSTLAISIIFLLVWTLGNITAVGAHAAATSKVVQSNGLHGHHVFTQNVQIYDYMQYTWCHSILGDHKALQIYLLILHIIVQYSFMFYETCIKFDPLAMLSILP